MENVNYYLDEITETVKGSINLNGESYAAELMVNGPEIKIRVFDVGGKITLTYQEMSSLDSMEFQGNFTSYLLFGINLNKSSFMKIGSKEIFNDYTFFAQGFLYSKMFLNNNDLFTSLSMYGENIKKWSGSTKKLDKIIDCGITNTLPEDEDCCEFEAKIPALGIIGLNYTYRLGGLDGLHTVGMKVEPCITLIFEKPVTLDLLIKNFTDLYMLLRFLVGGPLIISNVKVGKRHEHPSDSASFYLAEKESNKNEQRVSMLLPYASMYRDGSESDFPKVIWESYYDPNNKNFKELICKCITYSMVHDNQERFLGFYRIIESLTIRKSSYVDEDNLSSLLKRVRPLLAKQFPGTPLGDFLRAIKRVNKNKNNTEGCIHHFIKELPCSLVDKLNIDKVDINDFCKSRNNIIHQPLYHEIPEKIFKHMLTAELLTKIALLIKLGVSVEKLEEITPVSLHPLI